MAKIKVKENYVSIGDYAKLHDLDPDAFLDQCQRVLYNTGATLNTRYWIDNLTRAHSLMQQRKQESSVNEASALIRGGKPTKLFAVVNTIASLGNKARSSDLTAHFVQPIGFYSMLKDTPGIIKDTSGTRPLYSVSDDLYKQYVDACKQLGKRPWSLEGTKPGSAPASPAPAKPAAPAAGSVIPFDQCFFAEMILDAKDYSGGRECSWIDPKNLNHVLSVYEDDEGTPLSRKMGDLKQKYDILKEKCLADGKAKVSCVGEDYGTIDSESIPGIKDYLEMWPKHSPDGRVQQATSLWMCVAPSRDKVEFDSNEWNSRPVKDK